MNTDAELSEAFAEVRRTGERFASERQGRAGR
jgi:hypothetical protein